MSNIRGYLCGVPDIYCRGSRLTSDVQVQHTKVHGSRVEAFNCMARYLINQLGYSRIGPREFFKEGEPVRVLTKKSRYGGELRKGKEVRLMPKQFTGGLISSL